MLCLYPLLIYYGYSHFGVGQIALLVMGVCGIRLVLWRGALGSAPQILPACAAAVVLAAASVVIDSPTPMLYYPVLVNALLLAVFAWSMARPPTVVERIARIRQPDLPATAVPYLRRVTMAWVLFFLFNGTVALYTAARASLEIWTLYNGLIAYLLIGAMFAGELLTRSLHMRNVGR